MLGTLAAALGLLSGQVADANVTTAYTPDHVLTLAPGITHSSGTMRTNGDRIQAVQVATIDPSNPGVRVRALLSNDHVVGTERPSQLADRKSVPGSLAMVATNGDVSVAGGDGGYTAPHSLHVQGGEVMVSPPCTRPTLGVDANGKVRIGDVKVKVIVVAGNTTMKVKTVNMPRTWGGTVLYTPRFGARTLTDANGTEVVLSVPDILRPHATFMATVVTVRSGAGNTPLQAGQMVLSASGSQAHALNGLKVGRQVSVSSTVIVNKTNRCGPPLVEDPAWFDVTEALGGNYYDAHHGSVAAPSSAEYPKGSVPAPRTSVGVTADGHVLMVVVDGRQPGYSVGVTLAEMGQLMLHLGATDAINLDGGGSTIMAVRKPGAAHITVSDRPSDGRERSLTQALAVFSISPTN